MGEPMSIWDGKDLLDVFLRNEVSNHKPRATTGKVALEKQGTVVTVQSTELLPNIFQKLSIEGFLSAPVCSGSEVVGQITLLDLVKYVNGLFFATSEEEWTDWWEKKMIFQTTPASSIILQPSEYLRKPYHTMNEHFTSFSAMELMARSGAHQVLLFDDEKALSGIITQSMLISFLRQTKAQWGKEFENLKVCDFESVEGQEKKLQVVTEDELAVNAFLKMEDEDLHGLPIVDSTGVLTGCISVRDLRGCGTDGSKFYRLFRNVRSFKAMTRAEHDRLAPSTHYSSKHTPTQGVYVTPEDTMADVIVKMNDGNLHRIFVCDEASHRAGAPKPIGVVSQRDVLLQALNHCIDMASARSPEGVVRQVKARVSPSAPRRSERVSPGRKIGSSPGKRSIPIA